MKVLVTQLCLTLCDPMDCVAHQVPLSMELSRQECWGGLPFPNMHESAMLFRKYPNRNSGGGKLLECLKTHTHTHVPFQNQLNYKASLVLLKFVL